MSVNVALSGAALCLRFAEAVQTSRQERARSVLGHELEELMVDRSETVFVRQQPIDSNPARGCAFRLQRYDSERDAFWLRLV